MRKRLRATIGFTYPADAASLETVRAAGGASRLSPDALRSVRWKRVEAGEFCDDMPDESAAIFLARGDVEIVAEPSAGAAMKGVQ